MQQPQRFELVEAQTSPSAGRARRLPPGRTAWRPEGTRDTAIWPVGPRPSLRLVVLHNCALYLAASEMQRAELEDSDMKTAIVLGGGIGGVEAAIRPPQEGTRGGARLRPRLSVRLSARHLDPDGRAIVRPGEDQPQRDRPGPRFQAHRRRGRGGQRAPTGASRSRMPVCATTSTTSCWRSGAHKMPHKGKEHVLSICGAPEESVDGQGAARQPDRQGHQGPSRSASGAIRRTAAGCGAARRSSSC